MNWKFWSRDNGGQETAAPRWSKPAELPDGVGRYLVVTLKQNPDWVWGLKALLRRHADNGGMRDVVIFDPHELNRRGISVKDFDALAAHPEYVLFEGWHDKQSGRCDIRPRTSSPEPEAAAAATV